jgi:hypothetical protein
MTSPVLFIVFNRPQLTRKVFEAIRSARPPRLYISADGPRSSRPDEQVICEEVRKAATAVDWPCDVKVQFFSHNLGCKFGESAAMDWFFRHEEEGIILEDDTLPVAGFFQFCEVLLDVYRDNTRVFSISGTNYLANHCYIPHSYAFSRYGDYWGWAGWRRSWRSYDVSMKDWPGKRESGFLRRISEGNVLCEKYWREIFDATHAGSIDTWDYQRLFTMWQHDGLTIFPRNNMVTNMGFGPQATHTKRPAPAWISTSKISEPIFPLIHPSEVRPLPGFDSHFSSKLFGISRGGAAKRLVTRNPIVKTIRRWMTTA